MNGIGIWDDIFAIQDCVFDILVLCRTPIVGGKVFWHSSSLGDFDIGR